MAGLSMLRVVGNAELVAQEKRDRENAVNEKQADPFLLGMVTYLRSAWDAAKTAKEPIEHIMLKAMRQRNGEYESDKLSQIQQYGGSEVFMMITEVKCRAAESWLRDILMDTGTPPWSIEPTPIPDLPDSSEEQIKEMMSEKITNIIGGGGQAPSPSRLRELKEIVQQEIRFAILQEARATTDRMKLKISDQFAEGGWAESFNEFITDIATFPAGIIKGPIVRRQRRLAWAQGDDGKTTATVDEILAPEYERVDPFRIFPEPGISRISDGYLFQHHPLPRPELADLIGVTGYDDDAIRTILSLSTTSSWINMSHESEKEHQERKFSVEHRPTEIFDALEFWGKISGKMLVEWGMDEEKVPDQEKEYDANIWLVGNYVIKAVLNYDPLGEKPYAKTSYIRIPGAFWGKGIPEIIEDVQGICNAAARALVNNMGIASGPQVEVNLERIPPNEDITQIHPWKIWQVLNDPLGSSAPAVRFNQPDDNASTLMGVYEKFSALADDHSGVPAYVSGNLNVGGAGRTASGLSMLMGSAGKGIRQVVMHIDADIIYPVVHRQFVYNMRYVDDESIKGDAQIMARGAINLAVKDTVNVRRAEFLQATANEFDMEIMGLEGRAVILREVAKGLQLPEEEIVPSREKAAASKRTQPQSLQPDQGQQQLAPPQNLQPGGAEQGGQEANLVSNSQTGRAG